MNRTVLIADSDAAARGLVRHVVEHRLNCSAVTASNISELRGLLDAHQFGCIVASNTMSDSPGVDALTLCRRGGLNRATPFICLSAKPGQQDFRAMLEAGAFDVIPKPISDVLEVQATVRRALTHRLQETVGDLQRGTAKAEDVLRVPAMPGSEALSQGRFTAATSEKAMPSTGSGASAAPQSALPFQLQIGPQGAHWRDIEHAALRQTLEQVSGNISRAATLLGLSRSHLRSRLRFHRLGK